MSGAMANRTYVSAYLHSPAKRCFDIVVSLVLLVPAAIVMTLAGLFVLVIDGRPVVLLQRRAGRDGRWFTMPKLRTMAADAVTGELRITRTGRFLRRHRLDELPQLLSVLAGTLSMVGPRPELCEIVGQYTPRQAKRLLVRAGATGLWQVLGSRRRRIHEEMRYDLYYLRKASLLLDTRILAMTVCFVIRPGGGQT